MSNNQKTHWKKLTNPNYLGSWDIPQGDELVVTIKKVVQEKVMSARGEQEDCIVAYLDGQKPFILNVTNCKTIAKICESSFIEDWTGKSIALITQKVRAFGDTVDAIRVKPVKVAAKQKETLSPASSRWQKALEALKNGTTTVEFIASKFTIAPQDLETLKGVSNAK